jgi:hypothetical protein
VEPHTPQIIEILDSDDDEKDTIDVMELMEEHAVPAPSPITNRISAALHSTVTDSFSQMPIRAPAPTPLPSVRPRRKISHDPRRRQSLPSSSRGRGESIPPAYQRSPSPLGGHATYRPKSYKRFGRTHEQRERLSQMAQDGMFKQDFMDDNYVWVCPVTTCRHIFRMKESESWTEEVRRSVTAMVRPYA